MAPALRSAHLLGLILASLPVARADVFVDVNGGSDTSGDGSAGAPWRSVTFALTQIASPEVIRVAPGNYREGTGEVFPIRVPCGVSILAEGNSDDTRISAPPVSAFDLKTILCIEPGPAPDVATLVRGIELFRGAIGIEVEANGSGPPLEVAFDDVYLNSNAQYGLRAAVIGGSALDLELREVRTNLQARALRVRVSRGSANVAVHRCRLDGLVAGVELRALGEPGASTINADVGNLLCRGSSFLGLAAEVSEGNFVVTRVRDSYFAFHAPCVGTPLPGSGAIGDLGPADGHVFHDVARTIFFENGQFCPPSSSSKDLPTYRPNDYTLADNLYGWGGVPGGQVTSDPGFVGGADLHLRADALALDAGTGPATPYLWGDLDGEFAVQDPTSSLFDPGLDGGAACFPGPADIGPDERRTHAAYASPDLAVGGSSVLRLLGPPLAPGESLPIGAVVFVGLPPTSRAPCAGGLALPPGAILFDGGSLDPTSGRLDLPVVVPDDPGLAGRELGLQAAFLNPNSGALAWSSPLVERVRR